MSLKIKSQSSNAFDSRWFDYQEGISFKIGPIDRDEYRIGIERARRLIDRKESRLDLHNLSVDAQDRTEQDIQAELIGRYIILDWKGDIQDEQGEAVPYSPDQASALLRSEPSLTSWALSKSIEVAIDMDEEKKDIGGKPLSDSNGKMSGEGKPKKEN